MPTLRACLEADGNKSDAAASLHIQRRTLYNRLDRIAALLGRSLEDAATRQSLYLATKSLDLSGATPRRASQAVDAGTNPLTANGSCPLC
jgi:purine catabolism regulator